MQVGMFGGLREKRTLLGLLIEPDLLTTPAKAALPNPCGRRRTHSTTARTSRYALGMVSHLASRFADAVTQADNSEMTARLPGGRRWLRLLAFIPLATLATLLTFVAFVIVGRLSPAIGAHMFALGERIEDTPLRLIEEGYRTLTFGVMVGLVALSLLATAALTWRAPVKAFLWPDRAFDGKLFGLGMVTMIAVSTLWIPFSLTTGSEWRPPVFDTFYVEHTRFIYVLAMVGALLAGAAAEEIISRGVLLRVSALVTRRSLLLCLINGLLFSAVHLDPDPVSFLQRTLAGMSWTWAALRLGGLEFAIGAHFANNLFITLMWSPASAASQTVEVPWFVVIPELITTAVVVGVVELLAQRRHPRLPDEGEPQAA
jgi:uncharacterized protein